MIDIEEICKKYDISLKKVKCFNFGYILFSENNNYLVKESKALSQELIKYFESISYPHYLLSINDGSEPYKIFVYNEEKEKDLFLKGKEIIKAITSLQLKSVYYEELLEEDFLKLYKKISSDIDYQMKHYLDLQDYIESFSFPKIDYYYLLLNISSIYKILQKARYYLDLWYQKKVFKVRKCYSIHDVSFSNFCFADCSYFIDFDACYKDFIVSDFSCFYKKEALNVDMISLFRLYQSEVCLSDDELLLLKAFVCIPEKLIFTENTYSNTILIYYLLEYIEKTDLFLEENEKNQEANEDEFKE